LTLYFFHREDMGNGELNLKKKPYEVDKQSEEEEVPKR
jgi:hypothetical protein